MYRITTPPTLRTLDQRGDAYELMALEGYPNSLRHKIMNWGADAEKTDERGRAYKAYHIPEAFAEEMAEAASRFGTHKFLGMIGAGNIHDAYRYYSREIPTVPPTLLAAAYIGVDPLEIGDKSPGARLHLMSGERAKRNPYLADEFSAGTASFVERVIKEAQNIQRGYKHATPQQKQPVKIWLPAVKENLTPQSPAVKVLQELLKYDITLTSGHGTPPGYLLAEKI